jgi:hypothetical protein
MDNTNSNGSVLVLDHQGGIDGNVGTEFQPGSEIELAARQPPSSLPAIRAPIRGANRPRIPFDTAAARVSDHGRGLTSERFPMSRLRLEGGRMIAGDRELRLEGEGLRRLCGNLGAPVDYVAGRLSPEVRDHVLEFHLESGASARGGLSDANSRILSRDGAFVALSRSDLRTLEGDTVLQAVRDGFEDDAQVLEVQNLHIEDEAFQLDILSPSVLNEVRPGDVIQGGIHVEHSCAGLRATTVMAFVDRLVCSNGMVHRECLGSRRTERTRRLDANRHDAEPLQIEQIKSLVVTTRRGLAEKLERIQRLT